MVADTPTSGKIQLDGTLLNELSATALSELRLRKLGFVFQAYNLIPVLTALENVEFTMMLLGVHPEERRSRSLQLMDELGIAELAEKRPNKMSGGQQQRVAVARAIVTNPSVVLADEPTANLDSQTGDDIIEIMREMNQRLGITFLFSTHDPKVMSHARRVITLTDGRIVSDETGVPA